MRGAFLMADSCLVEPIYRVNITGVRGTLNEVYSVLRRRNGRVVDVSSTLETLDVIHARVPVRCASGLSDVLRLATYSHAHSSCTFDSMELIPATEDNNIILEVRKWENIEGKVPVVGTYIDRL